MYILVHQSVSQLVKLCATENGKLQFTCFCMVGNHWAKFECGLRDVLLVWMMNPEGQSERKI